MTSLGEHHGQLQTDELALTGQGYRSSFTRRSRTYTNHRLTGLGRIDIAGYELSLCIGEKKKLTLNQDTENS
jgi:hypothetical protein